MSERNVDIVTHRADLKTAQQRWIESSKGSSLLGGHVYQTTLTDPGPVKSRTGKTGGRLKKSDEASVSPKASSKKTILTPVAPSFGFCDVPQLNLNSFPVTASEVEAPCKPDREFVTDDGKVVKILRIEEPLQERINKPRSPMTLKTVIPCKDDSISNQKALKRKTNAQPGSEKVKNKKETYYRLSLTSGFAERFKESLPSVGNELGDSEPTVEPGPYKGEYMEVNENDKNGGKGKSYDVSKTREFIKQKRKEREDQAALEKRRKTIEKEEKLKKINEIRETQKRIMKNIKKRPLRTSSDRPQWIGPMEPHKTATVGRISVPEPKSKGRSTEITGAIAFTKPSQANSDASDGPGVETSCDGVTLKTKSEEPLKPLEVNSAVSVARFDALRRETFDSTNASFKSAKTHFESNPAPDNRPDLNGNEGVRLDFNVPSAPSSVKTGSSGNAKGVSPQYVSIMDKYLAECPLSRSKSKINVDRRRLDNYFMGDIECDPMNLINSFKRKLDALSREARTSNQISIHEDLGLQIPVKDNEFTTPGRTEAHSEDARLLEASRERVQAFRCEGVSSEKNRAFGLRLPEHLVLGRFGDDSLESSVSSRSCFSQMPEPFRYESSESSFSRSLTGRSKANELKEVNSSGGYTSESVSEVIQISRTISRGSTVFNEDMSEIHNSASISSQSIKFNTTSVKNEIQSGIEQLDKVDHDLTSFLITSRRDRVPSVNITTRDSDDVEASNALSKIAPSLLHSKYSINSKEFDLQQSPSLSRASLCREMTQSSGRCLDLPSVSGQLSLQVVEDLIEENATLVDKNIDSLKRKAKSVKSRAMKEIENIEIQRKRLLEAGHDEEARELKRKQRKLLLKMNEEIREIQSLRIVQENVARQRSLLLRQQQHLIKLQLQAQKRDFVDCSPRAFKSVRGGPIGFLDSSASFKDADRPSIGCGDSLDRVARDLKTREEELRRRKEQAILALKRKLELEEKNVKEIEKLTSLRAHSPGPVDAVDRGTSPFLEIQEKPEVEARLSPEKEIQTRPTSASESESLAKDDYSDSFEQSSVLSEGLPNVTLRKSLALERSRRMPIVRPPLSPRATILKRRHSSESDDSVAFSQNETLSELSDDKARVCALKQQLKQRKAVWGKLNDEYKKNQKERLKATEKSLISQIQVYDSYIDQIKKALQKEIESGTVSVTRPQIKQPKLLERRSSDKFASQAAKKEVVESTNSESSHNSTIVSPQRPEELDGRTIVDEDAAKGVDEVENAFLPSVFEEATRESVDEIEMSDDGVLSEIKTVESNSARTDSELALSQSFSLKEISEDLEVNESLTITRSESQPVDDSRTSSEASDVEEETLKVKTDKNSGSDVLEVVSDKSKDSDFEEKSVQDEVEEVLSSDVKASEAKSASTVESTYEPTMKLEGSRRSISELINASCRSSDVILEDSRDNSVAESVSELCASELREATGDLRAMGTVDEIVDETELEGIPDKSLDDENARDPVAEDLEPLRRDVDSESPSLAAAPEGGVLKMLRDSFQLSSDDNQTWEMNLAHFQDSGPGTPLITALQRERRQSINADVISKQICDMIIQDATSATIQAFSKKKIGLPLNESNGILEEISSPPRDKKVGENEGFWLGEGLTLQTAREAEQLRLQQLQIEQEIEQLEQAQEVVPYYYVRQIPNKPPPPYTPPRQSTPTREETIARVLLAAETLWDLEARGEEPSDVDLPATFLASVPDPPYRQFMFDLAKELYLKFRPRRESPGPPWIVKKRSNKPLPPIKSKEQLLKYIERETKLVFGFENKIRRENMIMRWTKKRRDFVDEILVRELQEEESEWSDFTVEENALKNQIADELIDRTIDDAVQSFAAIFAKKFPASS